MNLSTLNDRVSTFVQGRSEITSALRDEAINEAYLALCYGKFIDAMRNLRLMRFPELEARATQVLVTDQDAYPLASDMYTVTHVEHQYDSTSLGKWWALKYKPHYNLLRIQPTSGRPWAYTWHSRTLYVRNVPSSTENGQTLRVWYYKSPTLLSVAGDSPVIDQVWHPLIAILAAANLCDRFVMPERSAELRASFANELANRRLPHEMESNFGVVGNLDR